MDLPDFTMILPCVSSPIGSMYAIYGDIYHQYTPNVSIYTIHGSYGSWFNHFSSYEYLVNPIDFSPSQVVQLRAPVRAGPTPDVLPPVPDAVPRTFMSLAVSLMGKWWSINQIKSSNRKTMRINQLIGSFNGKHKVINQSINQSINQLAVLVWKNQWTINYILGSLNGKKWWSNN